VLAEFVGLEARRLRWPVFAWALGYWRARALARGDECPSSRPAVIGLMAWPYKAAAILAIVAALALVGYVKGRGDVRALWDAERAGYRAAAAQAAIREAETAKRWRVQVDEAQRAYDGELRTIERRNDDYLDRLRDALARSDRVRAGAPAPAGGEGAGRATAAELFGKGEELARLVREADRDRAALIACVGAWPR
jgi:hypothetical protein